MNFGAAENAGRVAATGGIATTECGGNEGALEQKNKTEQKLHADEKRGSSNHKVKNQQAELKKGRRLHWDVIARFRGAEGWDGITE